jgi:hypothetical protein
MITETSELHSLKAPYPIAVAWEGKTAATMSCRKKKSWLFTAPSTKGTRSSLPFLSFNTAQGAASIADCTCSVAPLLLYS